MKITNTKYSVTGLLAACLPSVLSSFIATFVLNRAATNTGPNPPSPILHPPSASEKPLVTLRRSSSANSIDLQTPLSYRYPPVPSLHGLHSTRAYSIPYFLTLHPSMCWQSTDLCRTYGKRAIPTSDWRLSLAAVQDLAKGWRAWNSGLPWKF